MYQKVMSKGIKINKLEIIKMINFHATNRIGEISSIIHSPSISD
jgi:hypothetical protein